MVTQPSTSSTHTLATETSTSLAHAMATESSIQAFHFFPDLPPELCCQIWAHALPKSFSNTRPRRPHCLTLEATAPNGHVTNVVRSRDLHPLFYVNRESRSEASRIDDRKRFAIEYREPTASEDLGVPWKVCLAADKEGPSVCVNTDKEFVEVMERGRNGGYESRTIINSRD
jgi:hypothetical protein